MPLHRITRVIQFSYGHRLLGHSGKCRHLHGHNGLLEVDLEADSLDESGMVTDFAQVRDIVKGWVDTPLDAFALDAALEDGIRKRPAKWVGT